MKVKRSEKISSEVQVDSVDKSDKSNERTVVESASQTLAQDEKNSLSKKTEVSDVNTEVKSSVETTPKETNESTSTLHTQKPVPHEDKVTMPKKPAGEAYEDLLQKPPELTDVFDVVRNISSSWFEIGSELHVPLNVRWGLKKDMSLSDEAKLEKILNKWNKFETSDVTWKTILKALQALRRRDIVREALNYLERPAIYSKYIKKDDFTPCPEFPFDSVDISHKSNETTGGQPNDSEQSKTAPVSIPLKEIDRQHLVKAMKDGFVQSHITKAVIQGAARAGKTSLKSLILSLPYKELSTPCIEAPDIAVGTLSVDRFGKSGKCWTCVNNQDMEEKILAELQMIALKEEPSSTISPMIPLSVVSPRLNQDHQEMSQNDIDVSSEFPVTPGQTKDVEKAVAIIQELYHRCSKGIKAQELSLHERWLYFTDCGGQIQFQKLLPAFLPCASALMLVINLAEDLSGPASTEMCLETGQINVSEHSPKVEEMLKQLLVMVNSSSQQQKAIIENDSILSQYIKAPDSLSIMAIATHRDEYDGKSESIEDKEEKLRNILKSVEGKICYQNKAQFKILHEVDGRKAKNGIFDDPVVEEIALKLREQAYIVKVPLKWHCFQTLIQKVALNRCGVLNLSLCKVFGHMLGMSDDEVVSAIKFFHILNSMLYYPDSGADDIVFANLHCLIDIINELMVTICNARNLNIYPNSDIELLAMEGIATVDFIKTMEVCCNISKSFPQFVEKLLAIFQHLLIAVKVENNEDQFFIPALLPVCDTADINPFPESTIPPMLFYFKKGLPMGLFCSIIVRLLSRKWSIIRKQNVLNYSNFMIIQPLKRIGKFAIMETPYYIQLRSEFADDINEVRCAIHESVEAAVKGNVKPKPGFFCPCPHKPRNHIAVVAQDRPTLLQCCETNEVVEDTEGKPRLVWYGEVPQAASTPRTDETTSKTDDTLILNKSPDRSDIFDLIKCHSAKWDEFARGLRVDDNTRESLGRDIRFDDTGRLEQVLMNWIESPCSPVTWQNILDVLSSIPLKKTASEVKEYLKDQQVIDKYKSKPDYTPY